MGRNIGGGNKSKKFARKAQPSNKKHYFRIAQGPHETYMQCTRLSTGHCLAMDLEGNTFACRYGKLAHGKNKRANLVTVGAWLLVECYSDSTGSNEKTNIQGHCSLIKVYNEADKALLLNRVTNVNWSAFQQADQKNSNLTTEEDNLVDFQTDEQIQYESLVSAATSAATATATTFQAITQEQEINIDDL